MIWTEQLVAAEEKLEGLWQKRVLFKDLWEYLAYSKPVKNCQTLI